MLCANDQLNIKLFLIAPTYNLVVQHGSFKAGQSRKEVPVAVEFAQKPWALRYKLQCITVIVATHSHAG
jgi:hypothetical protein